MVYNDELTQQHGLSILFWATAEAKSVAGNSSYNRETSGLYSALAYRITAFHICLPDDPLCHMIKALVLMINGAEFRRVARVHIGTSFLSVPN